MIFNITYRDNDGKSQMMQIAANDRADAFRQLEERHISPIKVEEAACKAKNRAPRQPFSYKSSSSVLFTVIVAAFVIIIAALIAWMLWPQEKAKEETHTQEKKTTSITEVTPAPPSPPKPEPPPKDDRIIGKRGIPIETYGHKTYRDERGVLRYEGGLRVYDPNRPSRKLQARVGPPDIFPHSSENAIAAIITMESGDLIVGDLEYGDDFIEDFNNSLTNKITYSKDDTEYVRQVKDAVVEVKKELVQMMKRGEDIAQVMNEARNDLRNLFMYRQEIMAMVSETADSEETTDSEVKDIIEAANIMFREKGIKEIDDNEFIRMSIILERERARQDGETVDDDFEEEVY